MNRGFGTTGETGALPSILGGEHAETRRGLVQPIIEGVEQHVLRDGFSRSDYDLPQRTIPHFYDT